MTFRWHSLLALVLSASTVFAGWDGFPCPSNVSWYYIETNHYISQLYTALVERCKASGVSAPAVVDTYTNLFAGYTNTYTSTNGYVVTNNWIVYTNITVTNQFLPFAYSWSQPNGTSGTATCYPSIKQSWVAAWDSKFYSLFSAHWVDTYSTGILTNKGYITEWYSSNTSYLIAETITNIFSRNGIGIVTNGVGRFTHTPHLLTNEWVLGVVRKTTNSATSWSYQEMTPITTNFYDTSIRPVCEYWPSCPTGLTLAASFGGSNVTFTITGTILTFTSQTATNGVEVITITDSNDVATVQPWYRITGVTCSDTSPNSHDAWRIVYKAGFSIYGSSPYRLYALDINERKQAIDPLTVCIYSGTNSSGYRGDSGYQEFSLPAVKGVASNNYAVSPQSDLGKYRMIGNYCELDNFFRYRAQIFGWSVTNPVVDMPSEMTNQVIESYKYVRLMPFSLYSGTVFDMFGSFPSAYTNGQNLIQNGLGSGNVVYEGTWGSYNSDTLTSPWAVDVLVLRQRRTRGCEIPEWHMVAIHTNWMTKY